MSYKIEPYESVGESIRRIVCEQIDRAIDASSAQGATDFSPIQETRTHLKKARAALRLLRPCVSKHAYKREERVLRNVGRLISDVRDAEVRLDTVKRLRQQFNLKRHATIEKTEELLAFELDSFLAAFAGWEQESVARLTRVQSHVREWDVAGLTISAVCERLRLSYKRARAGVNVARKEGTAKSYHALRKQVKTLGYQLRMLRPLDPITFHALLADLKLLAQHLGHAHDLCFLAERLESIGSQRTRRRGQPALELLINSRQAELQRNALALAERFFAAKPGEFGKGLAGLFAQWEQRNRLILCRLPNAA